MSEQASAAGTSISGYRFPTGWQCVSFANELAVGEVKKLHYFDQDLVAFRGESGTPYVLDPHCLHLGAHLGVGGKVKGDCIVCPWHNWQWKGNGHHDLVPYSKQQHRPDLAIYSWPVREWCGMLLVWHDRHRRPPQWEPPEVPEFDNPDYYPFTPSQMVHRVKVHPQMIIENAADPYHIPPIHHGFAPETTSFETFDHRLHATIRTVYGQGKESTWLTPDGAMAADITYDTYGLVIGFVRFPANAIQSVQITSQTAVDGEYTDYYFMQASVREAGDTGDTPTGHAAKFLKAQQELVQQDFIIWENMKYLEAPNFAPEEADDYLELRRWARQFFPPETLPDEV